MSDANLLVIGGGPAGYAAAIRAAELGLKKIVLVEKEELGGMCLHHGCIPSKAFLQAAENFLQVKNPGMGISVEQASMDFNKLREWKKSVLKKLTQDALNLCRKRGVQVIKGEARFVSSSKARVGGKEISFDKAIIATGSVPVELKNFEYAKKNVWSSRTALQLEEKPSNLVVIGGGYVGTELATAYAKLGSKVTIVEVEKQILSGIDADIAAVVEERLKELGAKVFVNAVPSELRERDGKTVVTVSGKEKEFNFLLPVDKVLVAVGHKPNTESLGLAENTRVKLDEKGFIVVDKSMRTTDERIYAIGDVAGKPMLAHKAIAEGRLAAEAIAGKKPSSAKLLVPAVVFSDPEIALIGLSEQAAKAQGIKYIAGKYPFALLGRALTMNKPQGFVKILAEEGSHKILGFHAVGANASELVGEATLAMQLNATLEDIANTIHVHPTMSEAVREAALAALKKIELGETTAK